MAKISEADGSFLLERIQMHAPALLDLAKERLNGRVLSDDEVSELQGVLSSLLPGDGSYSPDTKRIDRLIDNMDNWDDVEDEPT